MESSSFVENNAITTRRNSCLPKLLHAPIFVFQGEAFELRAEHEKSESIVILGREPDDFYFEVVHESTFS